MNCRECTDFLHDYLAGDLPDSQQRVFEGHLELCPPCLTFLETYRKTMKHCQHVKDEPAEALPESLVKAILAARSTPG